MSDEIEIEVIEEVIEVEIGEGAIMPEWGMIRGELPNQEDLQKELDDKANAADLGGLAYQDKADWESDISNKPSTFPPSAHNHDDRYYTEQETDSLLNGKSDVGHEHDDRYYTEQEMNILLSQKANTADLGTLAAKDKADWESDVSNKPASFPPSSHNHDDRYYTETEINDFLLEVDDHLTDIDRQLDELEQATKYRRYGVSGIGQSASALTRLYDAVGMVAQVGTDGDNSAVVNDFDSAAPWERRKCVGEWSLVNGRAKFTVNAYLGDANYAEDGTMGDYVAVECPLCYYSFDGSTLIISGHKHSGMRPFDIFCHNHDENDLLEYYYAPAYALGKDSNGYGASLPGLDNEQGYYKSLLDTARTYKNGALGNLAILEPESLNFYEWALFTVEFAQQNSQNIMYGCAGLRHENADLCTFLDSTHVLLANYSAARVVGEYAAILTTSTDRNEQAYQATHRIVSLIRCDSSGNPSSSGTYTLIELLDLGKNYWTYDTTGATSYRFVARPYRSGACANVGTPSGSPVSNTSGYYPMQYRYRENVYANQYKTLVDRFNIRNGTGDSDYYLDHYYLPDPSQYSPSASDRPNASELAAAPFVKLGIQTLHENYANGYIKSKKWDETWPEQWIPFLTAGGSASTFWADYAYLVNSPSVRGVRLGGSWYYGAHAGFSFFNGSNAVSFGSASFGGDLCFIQSRGESNEVREGTQSPPMAL